VGQTVFITGAARGVGRSTAEAFARTGADLLLLDICGDIEGCPYPLATRDDLEETAERCRAAGSRVLAVPADVRSPAEVDDAVRRGREELGPFDVLVNNAGIVGPGGVAAHELDEQGWAVMIDIDLTGPWRCAKAVVPDLIAKRSGAIVNVASTAGLVAFPHFANYVAAKHGLIGLTRALALDYAPYGIRVNAVAPTSIRDEPELASGMLRGVAGMLGVGTDDYEMLSLPHHPLGSLVSAADVSGTIVWLASEAAAHITGAVIPVDAGFSIR
jgi:NAD(P)-dependent dehydrogenase (short-subunit alcohol dehydrogenase family)